NSTSLDASGAHGVVRRLQALRPRPRRLPHRGEAVSGIARAGPASAAAGQRGAAPQARRLPMAGSASAGMLSPVAYSGQGATGARISGAGLAPHVDASLVKAERTTVNVNFVLKPFRRDRLLAEIAKLASALAGEIPLWWRWRER